MARQTTTVIESAIAVDPPLVQNAEYKLDPADRQYIDSQIRGCERHLVDSLLSGVVCTWQEVDSTSSAISVGDAVVPTTAGKVAKATAALLAAAGSAGGIAVTTGVPGGKVRLAVGGRVPRTVTGLAAASAGFARINTTTARLEKVTAYSATDWPAGIIDADGALAITLPLAQGGGVAGTGRSGFTNVVYVDKGGDDATARRGNASLPFATITAALAAMQSGDEVRVGPGTWTLESGQTLLWPEIAQGSLIGSGRDVTTIEAPTSGGDYSLEIAPQTTPITALTLADFTVYNSGGGFAIGINGAAQSVSNVTMTNVRTMSNASIGAEFETVSGELHVVGCDLDVARFQAVEQGFVRATRCPDGAVVKWRSTDAGSNLGVMFVGCDISSTEVQEQGKAVAVGSALGAVTCAIDASASVALDACKLDSLAVTRDSGASRVAVSARGGDIAGAVSAGDGCDLDIRGSRFVQSSLAVTGDGTIERSTHREAIALINGDTTITFAVPFKTANYSIAIERTQLGNEAVVAAKSATAFTATSNAVDAASFMILHD